MSAASWNPTHTIPESGLPARSAPDASLEPLQRIRHGVEVMVVEQMGGWSKIQTDTGWEAWVDGTRLDAITAAPAAAAAAVPPPPPPPPATDPAPAPAPAPAPEPAATPAPEPAPEPEPEPIAPLQATHTITEKGAPTRSEPDGAAKTTGRLDGGTEVEKVATEGTWAQVKTADGAVIWVSNRSLKALDGAAPQLASTPEPAPAPTWSATHTIPDGGLPARETPDPSADPLLRIKSETGVRMIEEQGAWARITIESGWEAWVDGRRLIPIGGAAPVTATAAAAAPASPADPAPTPEPEVWEATHSIPDGGLSAWSEPKADRQPILRVKSGTEVQVVSTAGAWSRIRTEAGWEAWVDGRRLVDAG